MTNKSLVLIVGAGASNEADLPIGNELKHRIAQVLDIRYDDFGSQRISGDGLINDAFRLHAANNGQRDINPYLHSAWRIRDAMPQAISIDNFIDSHRNDHKIEICGKLAIARCILEAESNSRLKVDRSNIYNRLNFVATEPTWFNAFFQLLTENCQRDQLLERFSQVAIVCFNYDRCIEHYLWSALQNYYGIFPEEATSLFESLEIYHPYGTVGKLPWQDRQEGFDFGAVPSARKLLALADELKTFTEGINTETSEVVAIRNAMTSADRLAFLGFAFHKLNLKLLFNDSPTIAAAREVFGTALGISNADIGVIVNELQNRGGMHNSNICLQNNLKCSELFREFRRSLAIN